MTPFPKLDPDALLQKLALPRGNVSMVLDTDTYNEVDDQFAVLYAMLAETLTVKAIFNDMYAKFATLEVQHDARPGT